MATHFNALIVGGTGLISRGVVKHLLARGANVTCFNRGKLTNTLPEEVEQLHGDRNVPGELESALAGRAFDVVIDMICFNAEQAKQDVALFGGRCGHFLFCSTVCTYGVKVPPGVVVDETFPQEPISGYGRNKLAAEKVFLQAHAEGKFPATVLRPSSTYGPGGRLIDNLEFDPPTWARIEKGLPVLCSNGGMGLWTSTHRDDCGKLFAYAALNTKTFGQSYNATRQEVFTWNDLYREAGEALGRRPLVVYMPAQWIVARDPKRFGFLAEIGQFHGAYKVSQGLMDIFGEERVIDSPIFRT